MRSTFKVLFYVNGSKEKNGIVPIMGRVTINGSVAQFSCKQSIAKTMWDAKGNRAKGKSKEARDINLALDNIKAQIIKHHQRLSDREAFVTAEMVLNAYQGIGTEYETLLGAFDSLLFRMFSSLIIYNPLYNPQPAFTSSIFKSFSVRSKVLIAILSFHTSAKACVRQLRLPLFLALLVKHKFIFMRL